MKVFVAVPLVYNRSISRAQLIAKAITDAGHEIVSPWNLDPDEVRIHSTSNVFNRDISFSEAADVMVADITDPSTGVGMEVMAAHKAGRRVILVVKRGRPIPRILLDMNNKEFLEYDEETQITDRLGRLLKSKL